MKGLIKVRSFDSLKRFNKSRLRGKMEGAEKRAKGIHENILNMRKEGLDTNLASNSLMTQFLTVMAEWHKLKFFYNIKEYGVVINLLGYHLPRTEDNIKYEYVKFHAYVKSSIDNLDIIINPE